MSMWGSQEGRGGYFGLKSSIYTTNILQGLGFVQEADLSRVVLLAQASRARACDATMSMLVRLSMSMLLMATMSMLMMATTSMLMMAATNMVLMNAMSTSTVLC